MQRSPHQPKEREPPAMTPPYPEGATPAHNQPQVWLLAPYIGHVQTAPTWGGHQPQLGSSQPCLHPAPAHGPAAHPAPRPSSRTECRGGRFLSLSMERVKPPPLPPRWGAQCSPLGLPMLLHIPSLTSQQQPVLHRGTVAPQHHGTVALGMAPAACTPGQVDMVWAA